MNSASATKNTEPDDAKLHEHAREQVKRMLFATDMTQQELAEAIGRPQAWMSRYLRGEWNADFPTLVRIAQKFEVGLDTFARLPSAASDPVRQEWVSAYDLLTPQDRETFLRLVRRVTRRLKPRRALRPDRLPR